MTLRPALRHAALLAALSAVGTGCVVARPLPPPGAPISVEHGRVLGAEYVERPSVAPQGALVGGFLGFLLSGRSAPEKLFGTFAGAAAGSAIAESSAGVRQGWIYTVGFRDGRQLRVLVERGDLRAGDCVAVESARYVNLRRASEAYCEPPAPAAAQPPIEEHARSEASRCEAAKEELSRAKTREETEIAVRKTRAFCDM